jgi:hypothetical protein
LAAAINLFYVIRDRHRQTEGGQYAKSSSTNLWGFGDFHWDPRALEQSIRCRFWQFLSPSGLGSLKLDMTQAIIPAGESSFRVFSFIGDVRLVIPENVGVSISSFTFITDARIFGERFGGFFAPVEWSTAGYEEAEKKIRIERFSFLGNLRVYPADKT